MLKHMHYHSSSSSNTIFYVYAELYIDRICRSDSQVLLVHSPWCIPCSPHQISSAWTLSFSWCTDMRCLILLGLVYWFTPVKGLVGVALSFQAVKLLHFKEVKCPTFPKLKVEGALAHPHLL